MSSPHPQILCSNTCCYTAIYNEPLFILCHVQTFFPLQKPHISGFHDMYSMFCEDQFWERMQFNAIQTDFQYVKEHNCFFGNMIQIVIKVNTAVIVWCLLNMSQSLLTWRINWFLILKEASILLWCTSSMLITDWMAQSQGMC